MWLSSLRSANIRDAMTGRGNRLYTFNPQSTIENFTEANYNKYVDVVIILLYINGV